MMLETLRRPVIQAPMAGSSDSRLAIAVALAGGLGSIPCAMLDVQRIRQEVERFRAEVTAPINLNFFCHRPVDLTTADETRWRKRLAPYYRELQAVEAPSGASRQPFGDDQATAVELLRPEVVSFHFGLPGDALLDRVRGAGATVVASATTVDEAIWLQDHGADAIIVQGLEAGGHRGHFLKQDLEGQLPLLELLDAVIARVSLPMIAAGGIADHRDVDAAMARGAIAVQAGTAFLLCPEAATSPVHRRALNDFHTGHGGETLITNVFSGRLARGIANRAIRELGPVAEAAPPFPHAATAMGPLREVAECEGSGDFSPLWRGSNPAGPDALPAAEVVDRLCASRNVPGN